MKSFFKKLIVWILTLEARLVLKKYKPKIVGVTGSVGKTSTKDAIYTVLASSFYVRKSEKSFNSELGVPLTILGCDTGWNNPIKWLGNILKGFAVLVFPNHYPKWLVLEIGLDRPGDIARIVSWLRFDVAVFTKLAKTPVHVEFFDSAEALHAEKKLLAKGLKKHSTLVVNRDDPLLKDMKHPYGGRTLTYGLHEDADLTATNVSVLSEQDRPVGMTFKISHRGSIAPIQLRGALGEHQLYPILAGVTVGISQGINIAAIGGGLRSHKAPSGRMRLLDGINGAVLIDDTYNSSPVALRAALEALQETQTQGRRVAILGDMMELGKHTGEKHREIGVFAGELVDMLITVGRRAKYIAEGAKAAGLPESNIYNFEDAIEAGKEAKKHLKGGDVVLVKGSQSIRLEKATRELLARPEEASRVLVRQDKAWRNR